MEFSCTSKASTKPALRSPLFSLPVLPSNRQMLCARDLCQPPRVHPSLPASSSPAHHAQVVHQAGAVLPDLGRAAGQGLHADLLAPVQLLHGAHHGVDGVKQQGGGELRGKGRERNSLFLSKLCFSVLRGHPFDLRPQGNPAHTGGNATGLHQPSLGARGSSLQHCCEWQIHEK